MKLMNSVCYSLGNLFLLCVLTSKITSNKINSIEKDANNSPANLESKIPSIEINSIEKEANISPATLESKIPSNEINSIEKDVNISTANLESKIPSNEINSIEKEANISPATEDGSDAPLSALFMKSDEQKCKNDKNACSNELPTVLPSVVVDEYVPPPLPKGFIGPKFQRVHLALPRRELTEVGSVENITVNGRNMSVRLLSVRPLIYEITNFLSDNETELITEEAAKKDMKEIKVAVIPVNLPDVMSERLFDDWDDNFDGKVSIEELYEIKEFDNLMLSQDDIKTMYNRTNVDKDMNEFLTYSEVSEGLVTLKNYLTEREFNRSVFKASGVKEAWLWHDEDELLSYENLLEDYHDRISELTGIPKSLVEQTEPLQVQKKERNAFTPCQYDSSYIPPGVKCCVYGGTDCQFCRYATIHMFLNEVEGGELIFPLADEKEFLTPIKMKTKLLEKCEVTPQRNTSNLVIPVKRGNAILWYNHDVSSETGWMGQLEQISMSGMAQVESDKLQWTARMWIDIVGNGVRELRPWRLGTNWLSQNNRNTKVIEEMRNDHFYEGESYVHKYRKNYRRDWDISEREKQEEEIEQQKLQAKAIEKLDDLIDKKDEEKYILEEIPDGGKLPVEPLPPSLPNGMRKKNVKDKHKELRETLSRVVTPTLPDKIDIKSIDSRYVQAALLLLHELEREELETVARTLYEKLQVNCIPLIMNPLSA